MDVDIKKAEPGTKITITSHPYSGSILKSITAVRSDGVEKVRIEDDNTFIMPDSDVIVTGEFITPTDETEPYIDKNGEYILGTIKHFEIDGKNYAVNEDGSVGDELDSVELSYFDFALLEDDTYQIRCYTGPMDNLSQLEIPKTFNGKAITVLGDEEQSFMKGTGTQRAFSLVLNENVTTIKGMAFFFTMLTAVRGDTSGLNQIKDSAFALANGTNDNKLELYLDYPGRITVDSSAFSFDNITVRVKHATTLSSEGFASSIKYNFTDAHTYGEPVWTWTDNCKSATATFICTDTRCKYDKTVEADVTRVESEDNIIYTATAELNGKTYTDKKDFSLYGINVADSANGTVTADKNKALMGDTVNLTVTPDDGYKIKSVTVTDSEGKAVSVDNNYSFVMPASDVTVKAEFKVITYNISVGGVGINAKNCSDILGDGTASYNYGTNTLTLTNADIEVKKGNGIRYNESAIRPFTIVLNGANRITEVKDNGSDTCYGMALFANAPGFIISGSGSLSIKMNSASLRAGIHARKAVTVSGAKVYIDVTGSEKDVGIDLKYSDSVLVLENGARMNIRSGGIALQSNSNVRNLNVGDDCFFEAISDTQAVNRNLNLTEGHPTVKVGTDLSKSAPFSWDEKTSLTSYKYISIRGINAPCTVIWMIWSRSAAVRETIPIKIPAKKSSCSLSSK